MQSIHRKAFWVDRSLFLLFLYSWLLFKSLKRLKTKEKREGASEQNIKRGLYLVRYGRYEIKEEMNGATADSKDRRDNENQKGVTVHVRSMTGTQSELSILLRELSGRSEVAKAQSTPHPIHLRSLIFSSLLISTFILEHSDRQQQQKQARLFAATDNTAHTPHDAAYASGGGYFEGHGVPTNDRAVSSYLFVHWTVLFLLSQNFGKQ